MTRSDTAESRYRPGVKCWVIWPNRNQYGSVLNAVAGDVVSKSVEVVPAADLTRAEAERDSLAAERDKLRRRVAELEAQIG